jgi:hypothetical protein
MNAFGTMKVDQLLHLPKVSDPMGAAYDMTGFSLSCKAVLIGSLCFTKRNNKYSKKEGNHMKRKVMYVIIVAILGLSLFRVTAKAAEGVSLQVNDTPFVESGDVPAPYINHDGRTMVPLRFISEGLGASVTWNGENHQVMIQKGDTTIYVTVGLNQIVVNGSNVDMDTTAENTNGSVFVPARFVGEALGAAVDYNSNENKVYILTDKTNNFVTYGLTPKVKFPYTIKSQGLSITVNSIHIYDVNSDAAKAYMDKYQLSYPGKHNYFSWANITLKNESSNRIRWTGDDLKAKWHLSGTGNEGIQIPPGDINAAMTLNSTDYLWSWSLNSAEQITSNVALYFDADKISYVGLQGLDGSSFKVLAASN